MVIQLRNSLNEDEYDAFEQLFLTFDIQKKDVINSDVKDVRTEFNKQYRKLSLKYHPDKNPGNKEAEQKFQFIASNKPFFEDFIIASLEKGLSKRNNLMKELHNKLWSHNYEELQKYLDDKSRNKLSNKQQSMNNSIIAYSKFAGILSIPGGVLQFILPIIFLINNGVTYNMPITLGFFIPLLAQFVLGGAIVSVYKKNGKECNANTINLVLLTFDQECKDFSESDRTKLKWAKNLIILSTIISFSLMSYGVGIDLIGNGFGITNSMLLSGLLLSLPMTLLLITAPLLDVAIKNSLKKSAIEIIEEQFKGDGQCIEVASEKPSSTVNPDSAFNAAAHGVT